jgi:hypothetical protein
LQHESGVDILDFKATFPDQNHRSPEKNEAGYAFISGVGIREMTPDVPQCSGPQKRVTDRMKEYIRIGMSEQTMRMGNLHPAQNQGTIFVKGMNIAPETYAHCLIPESPAGATER